MTFVGMIFARGGSKGIPNKNLQLVAGLPLISRAIRTALNVPQLNRVIVSTDSREIADVSLAAGAEVPFLRPGHLAGDTSAEWLAWRHALEFLRRTEGSLADALVSVPATSPLRLASDIDACIDMYRQDQWDAVITVTPAQRNPYFNMVRLGTTGDVKLAIDSQTRFVRRQDAPQLYDMCTVAFVARAEFVLQAQSLWEGRVGAVVIPQERALDVDTPFDLKVARLLMGEGVLSPDGTR